ncbi:hypothetical protein FACS1894109_10940 [Spirochaetia bacterium]|nr:hypothetical protein FACS1894109_10940 [Spirochaetia bacterium]
MFTKEKTITVTTEDFIEKDSLGHAEFTGSDGKPYLVQVVPDIDARNPREEYDHLWTWTTSRNAGYTDKGAIDLDDIVEDDSIPAKFTKEYLVVKLFLYRHSGDVISMSNGRYPFNDRWDSGCMGIAYLEKKKAREEYGRKYTKKALKYLKGEIEEMNAFLEGSVYGIMITELESEKEDSCWGYLCANRKELESCISDQLYGFTDKTHEVAAAVMADM